MQVFHTSTHQCNIQFIIFFSEFSKEALLDPGDGVPFVYNLVSLTTGQHHVLSTSIHNHILTDYNQRLFIV